jgi:Mrp family chromosome partitioning ATPase
MDEVSPFEPSVVTAVRRHWRLVVTVVLVCTVPAALYGFTRPGSYTATAALTVSDPRGPGVLDGQNTEPSDRYVADQVAVFDSLAFGERAARRGREEKPSLKHPSSWFLGHSSAFANSDNSNVLSVSFSAPSAAEAQAGLRAAVAAYGDVTKAAMAAQANAKLAQLNSGIKSLDQTLLRLQGKTGSDPTAAGQIAQVAANRADQAARRDRVAGEAAQPSTGIRQALLPNDASATGKSAGLRLVVLALGFGLLIGIGLAYLRSYRKRVFMHERDPELVLHAPLLINTSHLHAVELLGIAPNSDGPFAGQKVQDLFGIAASLLADNRFGKDQRGLSLAVITAQNGASCTAVSWRTGLALAAQGLRVLLIDVEAAWPPAGAWMGQLTDRLPWEVSDDGTVSIGAPRPLARRPGPFVGRTPTKELTPFTGPWKAGVYLCGEAPPVTSQKELRKVFRDLEEIFDVVLVNAPPFLPSADAAHLASATGAAVVVVPAGAGVTEYEELVRRLNLAAATAIGYVYCCPDCDVPSPQAPTEHRLKRVLHTESTRPPLEKVAGLKPSS